MRSCQYDTEIPGTWYPVTLCWILKYLIYMCGTYLGSGGRVPQPLPSAALNTSAQGRRSHTS